MRFTRIFSGELYKIFSKKTLLSLVIGFILLLVLSVFIAELLYSADLDAVIDIAEQQGGELQPDTENEITLSGEFLNAAIEQLKIDIFNFETEIKADRKLPLKERVRYSTKRGELYRMKATLSVMEYCKKNNMPFDVIKTAADLKSAVSALKVAGSIFSLMAVIFAITAAARLIADEWKRGTLKMTLVRPVKREEIFGAKLLAAFTSGVMVYVAGFLLIVIYALARWGADSSTLYYVFNAKNAFIASSALSVVLQFFDTVIAIAAYVCFTACISVLFKNTLSSVVLPLISFLGIGASALRYAGIGAFLLSSNLNTLSVYFAVGSPPFHGMNFWWSFTALILYFTIFILSGFLLFKKRDIA